MMDGRCYLLVDGERKKAAVIDPDLTGRRIIRALGERGAALELILLTHGHFDHIGSVAELRRETGAPVCIHGSDAPMLTDARLNLSGYFGSPAVQCPAERLLAGGDEIAFAGKSIRVLHTPGHTPGSCCYLLGERLFSGDTLFRGGVGRADFPGGNMESLIASIRDTLMSLPEDTAVYPGHGEPTTIGRERRTNPYLDPGP